MTVEDTMTVVLVKQLPVYLRTNFSLKLGVQPCNFRSAYQSLQSIIDMKAYPHVVDPSSGFEINIDIDDLTINQRQRLMLWKLQFSN